MTTSDSTEATADARADAGPVPVSVSVSVNGETRTVPDGLTLDRLVATLTAAPAGVAAAVNETVVPRTGWSGLRLGEGDRVEVLTAVQGG